MRDLYFILPAGGVGSRMGADRPKQYLWINDDEQVIDRTIALFFNSSLFKKGAIGISDDDPYYRADRYPELLRSRGGESRAETVLFALEALLKSEEINDEDWVLVHDVARPALSLDELEQFIKRVQHDEPKDGAIMALPAQDTLKLVPKKGGRLIEKTLDRTTIWQAQTPQIFPLLRLYNALKIALAEGVNVTDEASVLEYNGGSPKVYQGYAHNLKITYPSDLALLRLYLNARKEEL